jgi:hypothetical protein
MRPTADPFDPEIYRRKRAKIPSAPVAKVHTEAERLRDAHFFPRLPERMFVRLAALNPVCFPVYLAIWRMYLTHKENPISVSTAVLSNWGIDRFKKYRALTVLESAGIIAVDRRPRKNPLVTLLEEKLRP